MKNMLYQFYFIFRECCRDGILSVNQRFLFAAVRSLRTTTSFAARLNSQPPNIRIWGPIEVAEWP